MSKFSGKQDCESIRELLSAYIDGQLAASERGPVEEHLASCKPCQEEFVSLRATKDMLQCLPFVRPARSFALAERPAPRPVAFGVLRLATAVAAFLLLLVGMGDWWHIYPTVAPPPSPVAITAPTAPTETAQPEPTQAPTRVAQPRGGPALGITETPAPAGQGASASPAGPPAKPATDNQAETTAAPKPAGQAPTVSAPEGVYVWPVRQVEIGLLLVVVVLVVLALVARRRACVEVED